jgi:DNA-binding beta-propeller fold protein YncE
VYVLSGEGNLYAIPNATQVRGKRILLPGGRQAMAITPNGKTIYVSGDEPNAVIPVSAVTDRVGKPIEFGRQVPQEMVITPNGKTVYVLPLGGRPMWSRYRRPRTRARRRSRSRMPPPSGSS